jgi:hypothetical protein
MEVDAIDVEPGEMDEGNAGKGPPGELGELPRAHLQSDEEAQPAQAGGQGGAEGTRLPDGTYRIPKKPHAEEAPRTGQAAQPAVGTGYATQTSRPVRAGAVPATPAHGSLYPLPVGSSATFARHSYAATEARVYAVHTLCRAGNAFRGARAAVSLSVQRSGVMACSAVEVDEVGVEMDDASSRLYADLGRLDLVSDALAAVAATLPSLIAAELNADVSAAGSVHHHTSCMELRDDVLSLEESSTDEIGTAMGAEFQAHNIMTQELGTARNARNRRAAQ